MLAQSAAQIRRALGAASLVGLLACGGGDGSRPNVLLVTIDTLRRDHTSVYGYARDTTPNLRELAYEGVRFEDAYAPSSTTAPTHASLFTGLYPVTHRVVKNGIALGQEHETLAQHLSRAGYQTAAVTSSFVLHSRFGLARGFDVYQDDFDVATSTLRFEGHRAPFDRRADESTTRALRWLREERDPARPFFLFVHYFDPHAPYRPPWPFDGRYGSGEGLGLIENEIRLYDAEIAYTDAQVARLLEGLAEQGLDADTLVVATADHGEGLGDHGLLRHGIHIYEESVRVPLLVRWPGHVPAGRSIGGPVELVDLAPTILELVGVRSGGKFSGRSLAAVLRGEADLDPGRPVHLFRRHYDAANLHGFEVKGERHAIVRDGWKYIHGPEEGTSELYDLARDPGELVNRVAVETQRASALADELGDFRRARERPDPVPRLSDEDRSALEALGYVE